MSHWEAIKQFEFYLGIPYALVKAGFIFGLLLLALVAAISDYSLRILVSLLPLDISRILINFFNPSKIKSAHLSGRFTYHGLTESAFGKLGYYLISLLQFLYPFLAMISYNVVCGDTLSKVFVQFFPQLGSSMGSVRFFIVFLVTLVSRCFLTFLF